MYLSSFNQLDQATAAAHLYTCCGSLQWVDELMQHFPFKSEQTLIEQAEQIWYNHCTQTDWLEAFTHHPKIGDIDSLKTKFANTQHLASNEQASVTQAPTDIIAALAHANQTYEQQFGFIFIVCATGKTANEMLHLLTDRLHNTYNNELAIAMGEQHKITIIRLKKLLSNANWQCLKVSQITTHILDTTIGKPAANVTIKLQQKQNNPAASVQNSWVTIAQGITNTDGRIADLLPPNRILAAGTYKMVFDTGAYFAANQTTGFYPEVEIQFTVFDNQHYHVPLLINPFGYSTYRGS